MDMGKRTLIKKAGLGMAALAATALIKPSRAEAGVVDNLQGAASSLFIGESDPGHNNEYTVWINSLDGIQYYRETPADEWKPTASVWS